MTLIVKRLVCVAIQDTVYSRQILRYLESYIPIYTYRYVGIQLSMYHRIFPQIPRYLDVLHCVLQALTHACSTPRFRYLEYHILDIQESRICTLLALFEWISPLHQRPVRVPLYQKPTVNIQHKYLIFPSPFLILNGTVITQVSRSCQQDFGARK